MLLVLTLAAAACGSGGAVSTAMTTTTTPPAGDVAIPDPAPATDRLEPGSQQASRNPEPVSEPVILTPVPSPVPEPTKPIRPGLPTPPPSRSFPTGTVSDDAIAAAVADVVSRLGIADGAVDVLDARDVTWRDGSVGCPEPGLAYAQAEVPGHLIVLRVGDRSYRYHAAGEGPFFYCETPQAPLEGGA